VTSVDEIATALLYEGGFYRAPSDPGIAGVGLGLAICRAIINAYGGTVIVDGEPGRGSTFTVHLPCRPAPAEVAA
jgi:signal transduction histidine kinase